MNKSHRSEPFDELARFDSLLTRIDPSLGVDVFNRFMTRPDFPGNIPQPLISAKKTDGPVRPG